MAGIGTLAKRAFNHLDSALADKNGRGMYTNDLDAYSTTPQLRADYDPYMDYNSVLGKYNDASDAAWELARAEQIQANNAAERANYANTRTGVAELRKSLAGSASSGANRGMANATALQALLGLGKQNSEATTQGMQAYQNAAKEAASARAQNAVSALDFNKSALDSMYGQATSAYSADHTYGTQGIAQALGETTAAKIGADSQERMNTETAKSNEKIAKTTQKQVITNKRG